MGHEARAGERCDTTAMRAKARPRRLLAGAAAGCLRAAAGAAERAAAGTVGPRSRYMAATRRPTVWTCTRAAAGCSRVPRPANSRRGEWTRTGVLEVGMLYAAVVLGEAAGGASSQRRALSSRRSEMHSGRSNVDGCQDRHETERSVGTPCGIRTRPRHATQPATTFATGAKVPVRKADCPEGGTQLFWKCGRRRTERTHARKVGYTDSRQTKSVG